MPKISILVPVYNVEKYLARSLDSFLDQTYEDLEVVCVNDGSTDGSLEILQEYQKKDPRIQIYSYENAGISTTRNRLLQHARGDYYIFADSDDLLDADALMQMMQQVQEHGADLVMCGFIMDYPWFKLRRRVAGYGQWTPVEALHALIENRGINNYPWAKLFHKSCFDGVSFPDHQRGFEDTCTMFKAMARAHKIITIPQRFYHYIQHSGSLTNNMSLDYVMNMRRAYHYQQQELARMFPEEKFRFDLQYYNTDMVIIYTLLLFARIKDHPEYERDAFQFRNLPVIYPAAYYPWLGLVCLKFGWNPVVKGKYVHKKSETGRS